jgi:hypothetical protein
MAGAEITVTKVWLDLVVAWVEMSGAEILYLKE